MDKQPLAEQIYWDIVLFPYKMIDFLSFNNQYMRFLILVLLTLGFTYLVIRTTHYISKKIPERLSFDRNRIRKWFKKQNWQTYFSLAAVIISGLSLAGSYLQFKETNDTNIKLSCSINGKESVDVSQDNSNSQVIGFLKYPTNCSLNNLGNGSTIITDVKPAYFYSEDITLHRNAKNFSFYDYDDNIKSPLEKPTKLSGRDSINFETSTLVPIIIDKECSFKNEEESQKYGKACLDNIDKLVSVSKQLLNVCKAKGEECAAQVTGKGIRNYLYETLNIPVDLGTQSINGVGQKISLFDGQVISNEVSLFSVSFPSWTINNKVRVLSEQGYQYIDNFDKPLYSRYEYIKVNNNYSYGVSLLSSIILYTYLIISAIGLFKLTANFRGVYRAFKNIFRLSKK